MGKHPRKFRRATKAAPGPPSSRIALLLKELGRLEKRFAGLLNENKALPANERFGILVDEFGVRRAAAVLGVSPAFVSQLKHGRKNPGGAAAARIQRFFGLPSIDWFEAA